MAKTFECPKCLGKGHIEAFAHIAGGECFQCGGEGRLAYRPKQAAPVEPNPEMLVPAALRASEAQWRTLEEICRVYPAMPGNDGISTAAFCNLVETRAGGVACLKYLTAAAAARAIEIGKGAEWRTHMRRLYGAAA